MKNIINISLALVVAILTIISCSKTTPDIPKGEFLIRGNISSAPDTMFISLSQLDRPEMIGSAHTRDTIIGGQFEIRGVADGDNNQYCNLYLKDCLHRLKLYLKDQTYIEISGEGSNTAQWSIKSNNPKQKSLNRYLAEVPSSYAKVNDMFKLYSELMDNAMDEYNEDREKNADAFKKRRNEMNYYSSIFSEYRKIVRECELEYLKKARVNDAWIDIFCEIVCSPYDNISSDSLQFTKYEALYRRLPKSYLATADGAVVTACMYRPEVVEVGDMMADGTLVDREGQEHTLSEYSGRYIMLNFWRDYADILTETRFSEVERMAENYSSKLTIINVTQNAEATWLKAVSGLDSKSLHMREASNIRHLSRSYGVDSGMISRVLIAPSGIVIYKWGGCSSLEKDLFRFLGAK